MKIKHDFVSNSSSTSFVYISDSSLTKEVFFEAAGVSADSPLADLFSQMHYELRNSIENGNRITSLDEIDALAAQKEFVPEVIEKMKAAIKEGNDVVTSTLSSESTMPEMVLCTEIFEIKSDKFYINAFDSYW